MIHLDSLTVDRQFVNMGETGMISCAKKVADSLANPHEQRVGGLMRYTLCVFQGRQRRNSFRNDFTLFSLVQRDAQVRPKAHRARSAPLLLICVIIRPFFCSQFAVAEVRHGS